MSSSRERTALFTYVEHTRAAVRCVTQMPMTLQVHPTLPDAPDQSHYSLTLNDLDPLPLRSRLKLSLSVGQYFTGYVDASLTRIEPSPYPLKYFYSLATDNNIELLTFQWTPQATSSKTFPHVHIGRAIVSNKTLVMPERFHKVHVPTGHVTLASVVRMAIEEFEVKPLTRRWSAVLDDSEHAELTGLGLLRSR